MISVVIPTLNAQATLTRCFDSLIGATVRGLVKEVVVADGGSTDDTLTIADAAGCHIARGAKSRASRLIAGAALARADWLLFLLPETALEAGWEAEADSFMSTASLERPRAAAFRFALDDFAGRSRRREAMVALRTGLFGLPYAEQGLLIPRRFYQRLGGHRDVAMEDADLVRRIGRTRLVQLRARAVNKPEQAESRGALIAMLHALRVPVSVVASFGAPPADGRGRSSG
jgi:glycosyltransferase involved in cell wall biosynthesis